jgi:tetratricopeptide (TPR) repeat protein
MAVDQEALRRDPTDEMVHINLGFVFQEKKQLPQAEAQFQQAEHYHPDSRYPYWNLGRLYANQEKAKASARELEQAVRLDPTQPEWMIVLSRDHGVLEHPGRQQQLLERAIALLKTS